MRILAPAKINLYLRVGKPRADGFHPIVTWMCTIGLFDTLIVEKSPGDEVRLSCDQPGLPVDSGNLVAKAADAMVRAVKGLETMGGRIVRAAAEADTCRSWASAEAAPMGFRSSGTQSALAGWLVARAIGETWCNTRK